MLFIPSMFSVGSDDRHVVRGHKVMKSYIRTQRFTFAQFGLEAAHFIMQFSLRLRTKRLANLPVMSS